MTRPCEFNRLRDLIDDAHSAGFTFHDTSEGCVEVHAYSEEYPGLVNGVSVHRASSIEDVLQFVDGVRWHRMYLRTIRNEDCCVPHTDFWSDLLKWAVSIEGTEYWSGGRIDDVRKKFTQFIESRGMRLVSNG